MLRLELLRQLRHELRAEGVGSFDDQLVGSRFSGNENKAKSQSKMSNFHRISR